MTPSSSVTARTLRKNQTYVEYLLWQQLRRKQIAGYKFRRQQPIGTYIVDFICYERKIVIELDGGQHNEESEKQLDLKRTTYLESLGYTVLRFWNNEVTENLEEVINVIRNAMKDTPLSNSLP